MEMLQKRIHYSVNLPNKGNKRKSDTFFFRHLIKSSSLQKNCTHYKEFVISFT